MNLLCLAFLALPARGQEADLILHHGKVFLAPGRYAQALAVAGNRIREVGTNKQVLALKGPGTRVIDLRGRAVTPGFHDAHLHFLKGSLQLTQADVNSSTSVAVVQERLRAYLAAHPGEDWVQGRGWDHTAFPGKAYPAREDLDAVSSTRPIVLTHVDGHMLWLNTEALRRAGLTQRTPDPENGRIVRGKDGEPSGILEESAMDLMRDSLPTPDRAAMKTALLKGLALARASGVTSIQGMLGLAPGPVDVPLPEALAAWKELAQEGQVTVRYFIWGSIDSPGDFVSLRAGASGLPPGLFQLGGLKGFVDGVISSRNAALLEPYADAPAIKGEVKYDAAKLADIVSHAHESGFQAVLHAIGDRAVRMSLDACEAAEKRAQEESLALPAFPCKIEHIELVDPADLPRFKALRVAASMQPSHMTYDLESQNYNPERLGARVRHAFAWKSLQDAGAVLAFGTDWPVMPLEPRVALFAATTRRHFDGKPKGGWVPEEKLTLEEAVRDYTLAPARAIGRDVELGSLEPGKLADLAVFDRDVFAVRGLALLKVEVAMTVFDGKVVFEDPRRLAGRP